MEKTKRKIFNINSFFNKEKVKVDNLSIVVFLCVFFLVVFGCLMVYSATYYSQGLNGGNQYRYLIKQIIGVIIGFAAMIFFYFYSYKNLKKFKWWAVIIATLLLLLVFVPFIGVENYGARRWIGFFGITFQPSEIAKFVLVLFAAAHFFDNYDKVKKFKTLLPVLAVGGLFCLLVILEPNMSITMCLALTLVVMCFIGGISFKNFAFLAVPGALLVPLLIFMEPYRVKRLMAFLDPWSSPRGEGFQLIQSLYALGSGGLFGVGLFNSRQKHLFLPFSESDFIFSIIAEEIGFVGSIMIIAIFAILIISLIKIALKAKNRFATLLVCGIATVISVQVIINIAVVTGSIPPTGLPLPFISAGGTSLMVFMSAIGICLNVRKETLLNKE
jgi:cell division protein FtsW